MNNLFLKIQEQLKHNKPFAVYAKPGSNTLTGIFQNSTPVYYSTTLTEEGFVFAPFANGNTLLIPYTDADIIVTDINITDNLPEEPQAPVIHTATRTAFKQLVQTCVDAIKSGRFEKLVTSRKETVAAPNNFIATYKKLLATYPNAFRYCFYSQETGLWMGATPEQLLKMEGHTLHTVALAGTQVFRNDAKIEWPEKEKQEQHFVTDYIIRQLQPLANDIRTTEPYTFRAGNLAHIKTDISAELKKNTTLGEAVITLHPTPAVCGLPKEEAKQFLLEHEGYSREYYSGFLGEINRDFALGKGSHTDLFVNLRCMKLENNNAHLYIGCGITRDSEPEKEFIETVNKSQTMRRVL